MIGNISNLESVHSQKIPIKVCVTFYNALSDCYIKAAEKKKKFFCNRFYLPKCIVVDLPMIGDLFRLLL